MRPYDYLRTVEGRRVHMLDWGGPGIHTLFYFPVYTGFAHDADDFAPLVYHDIRVIAVDPRGHGESEWGPAEGYTPEQYFADAKAIIDDMKIKRCIVMGSSFGAATAMVLAARYPDQCFALIMDDQPPEAPGGASGDSLRRTYQRCKLDRFASIDEVVDWCKKYRPRSWGWAIDDARLAVWAQHATRALPDGSLGWRYDPEILNTLADFVGKPEADLRSLYATIQQPALIVRAEKTVALQDPIWEEVQRVNPRPTYLTVQDAGHPVVYTQPQALADAVLAFAATLP